MTEAKVRPVKIRRGLYRLDGVTHTKPRYRGAEVCGGQVFAHCYDPFVEAVEIVPGSWECFCETCKDCDPNGWRTLAECVREAPAFWSGLEAADGS